MFIVFSISCLFFFGHVCYSYERRSMEGNLGENRGKHKCYFWKYRGRCNSCVFFFQTEHHRIVCYNRKIFYYILVLFIIEIKRYEFKKVSKKLFDPGCKRGYVNYKIKVEFRLHRLRRNGGGDEGRISRHFWGRWELFRWKVFYC